MIQAYFNQVKAIVDQYAATRFVLDANVSFEVRPGGVGVGNGLRPTLCRSSESHLRRRHGDFSVAKGGEICYTMPSQTERGLQSHGYYLKNLRRRISNAYRIS